MKHTKLISAAMSASLLLCALSAVPAFAEENSESSNLLTSSNLKIANFNQEDKTDVFNQFTNGDYTDNSTINRKGGNNTYYAVYEVGEDTPIGSVSAYSTINSNNPGRVVFYGSNDDNLALLTSAPENDLGWSGVGQDNANQKFKSTYNLTWLAGITESKSSVSTTTITQTIDDQTVYKYTCELANPTGYKYIVVLLNGWENTNLSEIEATKATVDTDDYETTGSLGVGEIFTVSEKPEMHNNVYYTDKGITIKTGSGYSDKTETIPSNIVNGTVFSDFAGKTLYKFSAIDQSSSSQWNGKIESVFDIPEAGEYTLSILCQSGNERSYVIKENDSELAKTSVCPKGFAVVTADISFDNSGSHTLTILGNNDAPNFIGIVLNKKENRTDAAAINDGNAYDDGSMAWTATISPSSTISFTNAYWDISNGTNNAHVDANCPAVTAGQGSEIVFGLVLSKEAIGDNTISDVDFVY